MLTAYAQASVGGSVDLTEAQKAAADVNGDGVIDADDAYYVLLYYAYASVGIDVTWDMILG